jgi:hypothetical protein
MGVVISLQLSGNCHQHYWRITLDLQDHLPADNESFWISDNSLGGI